MSAFCFDFTFKLFSVPGFVCFNFCFLLSQFLFFTFMFLSQLPTPTSGEIERWIIPAAALLSMIGLWKKVFPPRRADDQFATKVELQQELARLRMEMHGHFLALTEKIDQLTTQMNDRFAKLEAAVARLDERTKPHP